MFAILGATGKIGRATIQTLLRRGARVRAIVRNPARAEPLRALGCEIAVGDLGDAASLAAAVGGADAVQVICPVNPRAERAAAYMRGVVDTLAAALERARPPAVVAISDYGAEVAEGTGVTLAFHYLETRLRALPAATTFVRSAEHMENWARFLEPAKTTGILPSLHRPLTKLFPTVSAADVGLVAAEMLLTPATPSPRIVHVEGPRRVTPLDVAATFAEVLGREVVAREVPQEGRIPALVAGGLSPSYAELVAELYDAHNAGRIDAEPGVGAIHRGATELGVAIASLLRRAS